MPAVKAPKPLVIMDEDGYYFLIFPSGVAVRLEDEDISNVPELRDIRESGAADKRSEIVGNVVTLCELVDCEHCDDGKVEGEAKTNERIDTMYANAWAMTGCERVRVLPDPAIVVGIANDGFANAAGFTGGPAELAAIWSDLLREHGIEPEDKHFGWNFVSVQNR